MRRVCVYCGSNSGGSPAYAEAAVELADALVERGLELVYGGASAGIMGVIADRVLERGGRVEGVLPVSIRHKEIAHPGLTALHVVGTMHERKAKMTELSDAFIALPGGFGTLDELLETITWRQLGFHDKPCGLLNVDGYFDALLSFVATARREGFIKAESAAMLCVEPSPAGLLRALESRPTSAD